ncbi:mitochondrial protein Pet127-domain-containing protein [Fusarium redolens]|uniref:Mitochondrial protein Pet127-domain-containing protein n=1 Tax=Fusarium redolens TaxID=48865 RepID=A0A9P9KRJ1_FUSRE|nr:mitochondrial protein Pet127-domain-containing protein [Fusarium redolens]KAH7267093.1 mitochondrial protein Pet127-domain-containing protein [Fusarium redolens]
MLRLRRGIAPSTTFAHICRPHLRCPRQCSPLRLFATETSPDDTSKPTPKSTSDSEDALKGMKAASEKLQARFKKLEKGAKAAERRKEEKKRKAARSEEKGSTEGTTETDISDALAVAKRVYGIDKPKKKKKKKGSKPSSPDAKQATDKADSPEASSGVVDQQAGAWASLQEKLQQEVAAEPSNNPAAPEDDSTTPSPEQDQHIIASSHETEPSSAAQPSKKKTKASKKKKALPPVYTITPQHLKLKPVEEKSRRSVPKLAHQLDKVLFNGGPYQLQDQRTRVYNFDPYLASIMPVDEFDFDALKEYVTSSKDSRLTDLCAKYEKRYCGSTSSMTAMLSQFHFLLSAWRPLSFRHLSRSFKVEYDTFTALTRGPAAAFARYKDGVYAIDADKEFDTANVLSMLGKSMEKLLTLDKTHFEKYRRGRSHELSEEEKNADEAFHFSTLGDFMMRSQLDAHDPRLPGTGMFDLKTRAVVSIRMDVGGYEKGVGYEIRSRFGTWESFEREYYDMIRAAFLKYSLQVRMGRMDGIFVAFHNTQRIFGFQYISLEEMDEALHGTADLRVGDEEFKVSIKLLNDLLDRATKRFPQKSLRLHIETRPTNPPLTYFFAEPVSDKEMQETQEKGNEAVAMFKNNILRMSQDEEKSRMSDEGEPQAEENTQKLSSTERQKSWDEMMAKVDQTVEEDAAGLDSVREAIEQALEQSGLLAGKPETERESYLNELVEALTEELKDNKEAASELEDTTQKDSAEDDALDASRSSSETEDVLPPSIDASEVDSSNNDVDSNDVEYAGKETESGLAETGETTAEDEGHSSMFSDDVDGTDPPSNSDDSTDATLKDLIIKFAQGVDNNTSNLGTFERVLSELVRDQKEPSTEVDESDTTSIGVSPAESVKASEADKSSSTEEANSAQESVDKPNKEIIGLYVTVRNMVNGEVVERISSPETEKSTNWKVEYTVVELPSDRAHRILRELKKRRKKALVSTPEDREREWHRMWGGTLPQRTEAGRKYRDSVVRREERTGVKLAWETNANIETKKMKEPRSHEKGSHKKGLHKKEETSAMKD